jgi:hypothetical protein
MFIRHFKDTEAVAAALWVEAGLHGEFVWAIVVQQGASHCLLAGCEIGQSRESAT